MRNILFLIADDLGLDTGYLGNPAAKTPNLDRLAAEGVSFDEAFCTAAACSASRASMFNGLYGHQSGHYGHYHGRHHFSTFDSVETAPALLGRAGYLTAIAGKVHVGPDHVYPWEIRREGFSGNRDVEALSRAAASVSHHAPSAKRAYSLTPFATGTNPGSMKRCAAHACRSDPNSRAPMGMNASHSVP